MTGSNDAYASSDSIREAGLSPHAQTVTFDRPLALQLGGQLDQVTVCYETWGRLNAAKDNAIYLCHALSGDSHAAAHDAEDRPGWWDLVIGPGKTLDTDRYFVICANVLGGCSGTTGPNSTNPATGKPFGGDFPRITIADMVETQRMLIDHLGVEKLLAVIGGSMGGMMALQWALSHPDRLRSSVLIATTDRLSAQALAFDVVGRNAILKDPNYRGGQYYDGGAAPADGLAIARMIGHITYLSTESMASKFDPDRDSPREVAYAFEKEFSVGSYLAYQGGRFVERFDANSYLTLSLAMDQFNVAGQFGSLGEAFAQTQARFLVISFTSDWLFPPVQSRRMVDAMIAADRDVSYCNIESNCGHDAFLLENELETYGPLLGGFLAQSANGSGAAVESPTDQFGYRDRPDVRSIYHGPRLDLQTIEELIPSGSSVLDLGCGGGQLLRRLKQQGHRRLLGLEFDTQQIVTCVGRGLNAVQLDLDTGLSNFRDKQFDVVLLSQTLQTVRQPEKVLTEMLRVGKTCIVSFPNFAYKEAVRDLAENGVAPVTGGLPFKWYRTPNLHYLTIKDFENFCEEFDVAVHRRVALDTTTGLEVTEEPNRNADVAVFVISREG